MFYASSCADRRDRRVHALAQTLSRTRRKNLRHQREIRGPVHVDRSFSVRQWDRVDTTSDRRRRASQRGLETQSPQQKQQQRNRSKDARQPPRSLSVLLGIHPELSGSCGGRCAKCEQVGARVATVAESQIGPRRFGMRAPNHRLGDDAHCEV